MSVSLFFIIVCAILASITSSFYISYNSFTFDNAEQFCQLHCNSNLASIHNTFQVSELSQKISNDSFITSNLWIGLFNSSGFVEWTDGSVFDYGSDKTVSGIGHKYELTTDMRWSAQSNSITQMFVCNSCEWNVLSKYANLDSSTPQSAQSAQSECNTVYQSSLASVHSSTDNTAIKLITQLSPLSDASFIGLNYKSTPNQTYVWSDNTTLNYLPNNITDNTNNKYCTEISSVDGEWAGIECDTLQPLIGIICNAPNLFCHSDEWDTDTPSKWIWDSNNCSLYNDNSPLGTNTIKSWIYASEKYTQYSKIAVEYVWKLDLSASHHSNAFSGIALSFTDLNESISESSQKKTIAFFVGIHLQNDIAYLFMKNKDGLWGVESVPITADINFDLYHTLRLEFDTDTLALSLDGNSQYLSAQYIGDQLSVDWDIRAIDLQNNKVSAHCKSLYMNGFGNSTYPITTTAQPTTAHPTTAQPSTAQPTTAQPTTADPTTAQPTTVQPTLFPSQSPVTAHPTNTPTFPDCDMSNAIFAQWSRSYLAIHIYVPFKHNLRSNKIDQIIMDESKLQNNCESIFESETIKLLGSEAECQWIHNKNQARLRDVDEDVVLLIALASSSSINQTDSLFFLAAEISGIEYYCAANAQSSDVSLAQIVRPSDAYAPYIVLSASSTSIGVCDDLVLDARPTTFMGARDGTFEWTVTHRFKSRAYLNHYFGEYVVIGNKLIVNKLSLFNVTLTVTNWYNETSFIVFDVSVSDQATPKVSLSGTHIYKATRIHLHGIINVYSDITFNKRCLANNAPEMEYSLGWSADAIKLYNDTMVIDYDKLDTLNTHLQSKYSENSDELAIFVIDYLQPGLVYTFTLNLLCVSADYDCDIYATHQLTYDYSDLKCGIISADIQLSNVDPVLDNLYQIRLPIDGNRATFDPDMKEIGKKSKDAKKHLVWHWSCVDLYWNDTCDLFINDYASAKIKIDFGTYNWEYNSSYLFEFTMQVYDGNNLGRDRCFDSVLLQIDTVSVPSPTTHAPTTATAMPTTASPIKSPTRSPTTTIPTKSPTKFPTDSATPSPTVTEVISCGSTFTDVYNASAVSFQLDLSVDSTVTVSTCGSQFDTLLSLLDANTDVLQQCDDCGLETSCGICCGATDTVSTDSQITHTLPGGTTHYFQLEYNPKTAAVGGWQYSIQIICTTDQPTQSPTVMPSFIPSESPILGPSASPTVTTLNPTRAPFNIDSNHRKLFVVQASALRTRINVNERLGLIGDVINYDITQLQNIYYEWTETGDLLDNAQIVGYRDNIQNNSINLILQPNVLTDGDLYSFQLTVQQYRHAINANDIQQRRRRLALTNNTVIGYGVSAPIDIYVFKTPTVRERSFQIEPPCNNVFDTIYDLITEKHTLTISADDDYMPLLYQFGHNKIIDSRHYFHPSFIPDSSIYNVYLPIGQFTVFGDVINTQSAISTKYINCSVQLLDYSHCILTWKAEIIDTYMNDISDISYSTEDTNSYILSQTDTYTDYLSHYTPSAADSNDTTCFVESIKQIIDALHEYIDITCDTHQWTISLSQTVSAVMNLIKSNHETNITKVFYEGEYLILIQDLLFIVLDPCGCISDFRKVEDLYVHSDSVITGQAAIYYDEGIQETEITECLSPIISDPNYHKLLYSLASPVIDLLNSIPYNESATTNDLLLDAIYITQLILVSTQIPETEICSDYDGVSTCTIRTDTDCDDLNAEDLSVDVGDSRVYIPDDKSCDMEQTDIVLVGMPGTAVELTEQDHDTTNDAMGHGECDTQRVENSLSITMSSRNVTNQLQSSKNIAFTFECHDGCDDSDQCAWLDTDNNEWITNGCSTSLNYDFVPAAITCECTNAPLTTFAIIRNVEHPCNNPMSNDWLNSNVWDILIWIFIVIFLLIFAYSMFCCWYYRRRYEWTKKSITVIFLIGITALLYAFVCLFGYVTKQTLLTTTAQDREASQDKIQLYTIFLLLPQIIYFMIVSIIFYLWHELMHAQYLPDIGVQQKSCLLVSKLLMFNALLWAFLIIYYYLVLKVGYPSDTQIFFVGTVIWALLLFGLCLIFILYAFTVQKRIRQTSKQMKHLYNKKSFAVLSNDYGINILLIIAAFMVANFLFLCVSSIHFAANPLEHQTATYMIVYFIIAILSLLFVLFLYRDYLYKQNAKDKNLKEPLSPLETEIEINDVLNAYAVHNGNGSTEKKAEFAPPPPASSPPPPPNTITPAMHSTNNDTLLVLDYDMNDLNAMEEDRINEEDLETQELAKQRLKQEKARRELQLEREESLMGHLIDDIVKDEFEDWPNTTDEETEDSEAEEEEAVIIEEVVIEEKEVTKPVPQRKKKKETVRELLAMGNALEKEVIATLGHPSTFKLPKKKKQRDGMERDLRKIIFDQDNEASRKYQKLALLKWYDILIETFRKYCKIGQDKHWLTQKGWNALCLDAFIPEKKSKNEKCTETECVQLFNFIYQKHNGLLSIGNKKMSLRQSQILQRKDVTHNRQSTRTLILSEWSDEDPWTGLWRQLNDESDETYVIQQIGDKKIMGFIKDFSFCDINGSLKNDKRKCEMMLFWHSGARRNRRRLCRCIINKPNQAIAHGAITMTIKWKSIAVSSIVDHISQEKGEYTMVKMEKALSNKETSAFRYKIGLARHEYLDAMLALSLMKFYANEYGNLEKYAKLNKLCEENLIPFIWGGMENAEKVSLKQLFRPHSTELHRLFEKYIGIDTQKGEQSKLLSLNEWKVLCADVFKQDKNAFVRGGKPTQNDISSSYELSREGFDLHLTYRLFENALAQLAHKLYKPKPKAKYNFALQYPDKVSKLLKWCKKLEKSGYVPPNM